MRYFLALIITVLTQYCWSQDGYVKDRPADILHYSFYIEIDDVSNGINVSASIDLKLLKDNVEKIPLNFKLNKSLGYIKQISEYTGKVSHRNGGIPIILHETESYLSNDTLWLIPIHQLIKGAQLHFHVSYTIYPTDGLIFSKNRHGKKTIFADNWPNRCQYWLPVIDHPTEKATVRFHIKAPKYLNIIANGKQEWNNVSNGYRYVTWYENVPIPAKVMVIGAAEFAISTPTLVDSIPVSSWVFKEEQENGFRDYAIAPKILAYFIKNIGKYPYEKLANVQSKTRYGGMENASCIFYSENSVTGKKQVEALIAHEIVHQWFGNTVSEGDWFHLWLSEGFATYLTALYLEDTYGKERLQSEMKKARSKVMKFTTKYPNSPVVDTTVKDLNFLLNANNYEKGSWVLHMLRVKVGKETFWNILRTFYDRYKFGNAMTADFQKVAEEVTGLDLKNFFHQWLYVPQIPEISVKNSYDQKTGEQVIQITQVQSHHIYALEIPILISINGTTEKKRIHISEKTKTVRFKNDGLQEIVVDPDTEALIKIVP